MGDSSSLQDSGFPQSGAPGGEPGLSPACSSRLPHRMGGCCWRDLLLRFFFSFPFFQDSIWGSAPRRLETVTYRLWESVPLPHDISGLYCSFPHGCPDTGCCVYENSLDTRSEPPWRWRLCAAWAVFWAASLQRFWGRPASGQAPLGQVWVGGALSSSSAGTFVYKP